MKRTFLATVLSIVFAMVAVACHSSDEKEIGYAELPVQAQQFVKQYFPSATYSHVEKEKDHGKWEYEVLLSDGTKIDFNNKGEWKSVDCKYSTLPACIIPDAIVADIAQRYPSQQPYKIEKETGGYEIDIPGLDLKSTASSVKEWRHSITNKKEKIMAKMTLNEYQQQAMSTCMPESDNLFYMLANLCGEVGEFASKAGKHMRKGKLHITTTERDEDGKICHTQIWNVTDEERKLMLSEIGDILWQTAGLAHVMGVSLEEVAEENLAKLQSRNQRHVIAGDGDER